MDDLCTACLCGGRNLYFINETSSYNIYRDILNEVPMYESPEICVRICWECRARLSRYQEFKTQVQLSYKELKQYVEKKLHKLTLMRPSHLQIQAVDSFSYPKDAIKIEKNEMDMEVVIKSEVDLETHCEPEAFVNDLQVAVEGSTRKKKNQEKTIKKKVRKRRTKIKKKKKDTSPSVRSTTHMDRSEPLSDIESIVDYSEDVERESEIAIPLEREGDLEEESKTEQREEEEEIIKENGLNEIKEKKLSMKSVDANEKPQCVECGKMFSSRKTYRYHLNVLHKGQNRYPCPRCGKVYQWKSNLGRHMRSHKARDSGELYCDTCDKRFASVATYRQHLKISRRHVSENEFTFICNECGKKFVNKTRLRDHIDWEHLNKIKFRCQLCNKPFKCHTSLYVHEQNVHKNKEKKDNLCHVCGKSYQNAAKLKYHIVAMHTSETPYRCPQCAAAFGWYSSLYRHLREVHYKMKLQPKKSKKSKKPPNEVLPSLIPTQQIVLPTLHVNGPPQM